MELKEISWFEAKLNDLPAGEPGAGEISIWYALEDEEKYKAYMEITQSEDDLHEISFFMVPDIYRGHGYGAFLLEKFLEKYIPESTPDSLLTALYEYNGDHGDELSSIFSNHGFDINLSSLKECSVPFETVVESLTMKKPATYKGRMVNLTEGLDDVLDNLSDLEEADISERDIRESSMELSVAAVSEDGELEGLVLVSVKLDRREVTVTNLYVPGESSTLTLMLLIFAAENAANSTEPPQFINFVIADEKLARIIYKLFDSPESSELVMAEAEFNLGKYVEQLKLADSLRRE